MGILTREALLQSSDLKEKEIELPTLDGSVVVRSLPAAYSNEASSEALEMTTVEHNGRSEQSTRISTAKLEALKVLHGLVDPKLSSLTEVNTFARKCGPAWHTIVKAIDDLSGLDKDAAERTEAMFRSGDRGETGHVAAGSADADGTRNGIATVPVRTGV